MAQELTQEQINEFVVAAHHDLPCVKQKLAENPDLLNENAAVDRNADSGGGARRQPPDCRISAGAGRAARHLHRRHARTRLTKCGRCSPTIPNWRTRPARTTSRCCSIPAISGNVEIAQILLDAGADVNVEDGVNSPLHGAAIIGQTAMVQWLLDHDANPYAKDYEGKTPLDRAEDERSRGSGCAAASLLRGGRTSMSRAEDALMRLYERRRAPRRTDRRRSRDAAQVGGRRTHPAGRVRAQTTKPLRRRSITLMDLLKTHEPLCRAAGAVCAHS